VQTNFQEMARDGFQASIAAKAAILSDDAFMARLGQVMALAHDVVAAGGKILVAGNGGSAADAQHIAAELVGRFERERKAYPALALAENMSSVTGISNDYGYLDLFSRQVEAFGVPGDLLLLLSTSGRSPNVVRAAEAGRARGLHTVALTGAEGGPLGEASDLVLTVPSRHTPRIQETHLLLGHLIAAAAETAIAE
jgi:D-sedoheptulose 7-phosphate isomerase